MTDKVMSFFKGETGYAKCPNCSTGKLVPMFSGQALCDRACERAPKAVHAGVSTDMVFCATYCKDNANYCIYDYETDRHEQLIQFPDLRAASVRLVAGTQLNWTSRSYLKGMFCVLLPGEVVELNPAPAPVPPASAAKGFFMPLGAPIRSNIPNLFPVKP